MEENTLKSETCYRLYADYFRASGTHGRLRMLKSLFRRHYTGFNYIFALRLCQDRDQRKLRGLSGMIFWLAKENLRRVQIKYGTEIPYQVVTDAGLLLPHPVGIVIHPGVRIGKNCTILQNVTIGNNLFKSRYDVATIGNNVTIGAGAKIIGPVAIGDDVTIGANAVVTRDIPSRSIVAGIPARIITTKSPKLINCEYLSWSDFMVLQRSKK